MKEPSLKKKNVINRIVKNQLFVTISTAFLLIFILIGSSYAIFSGNTETGVTDVVVQSGDLMATITSTSDMIEINYDTLGVSDEIGLSYEPYTFTIENIGQTKIGYYEIRIVDKEYEISTLPHKALNFAISTNGNDYTEPQNLGDNKSYIYVNDGLNVGQSQTINLKLWVNEEFGKYANDKVLRASLEVILYSDIPTRNYIIYDTQGGSFIPKTSVLSKRVTSQVPEKEGLGFVGWSSSPNGKVEYESNDYYDRTNGTILYAVWGELPALVETIKAKVGTDGLVAVNTDGELASEGDTIREYRYSGSAKYCTYTVYVTYGTTYNLAVEGDTCPNACNNGTYLHTYKETTTSCDTTVTPNQTTPLDGEVDNYIWYNNEMWRIIGVFTETTGAGTEEELVKIIREVPLTNAEVPETYTYNGTEMTMKNISGNYANYQYAYMSWNYNTYFSQTNKNDWTKASLQYYLNDETSGASSYYNSINPTYQNMIEMVQYNISNVDYGKTASETYNDERSGNVHADSVATWTGKIGMMYPSDYAYAVENSAWSVITTNYGYAPQLNTNTLNNWMSDNLRSGEWTISPASDASGNVMMAYGMGVISSASVNQFPQAISPVIYLKSSVKITGGIGTEGNPYTLA